MPNSETVEVPRVLGLTPPDAEAQLRSAGLVVGTTKTASSEATPQGHISKTDPEAGSHVNRGSAVNLEVSSGPGPAVVPLQPRGMPPQPPAAPPQPAPDAVPPPPEKATPTQVKVPDVVGLTQSAAEMKLKAAGLRVGPVKTYHSNSVPSGGISSVNPDEGTLVSPGTAVGLDLSSGPEPSWTQYIPTVLFAILGIVILGFIGYIVLNGTEFLGTLAKNEVARGLITFLIAMTTVGIAVILAISTLILPEGDAGDKRFDRGKQVLSVLIGVLGTIVGFYFGAVTPQKTAEQAQPVKITSTALPDGVAGKAYPSTILQVTGGTPPMKWTVDPALPDELKLDSATGTISGIPKEALPKKPFKFKAADSSTPASSDLATLTLEVK